MEVTGWILKNTLPSKFYNWFIVNLCEPVTSFHPYIQTRPTFFVNKSNVEQNHVDIHKKSIIESNREFDLNEINEKKSAIIKDYGSILFISFSFSFFSSVWKLIHISFIIIVFFLQNHVYGLRNSITTRVYCHFKSLSLFKWNENYTWYWYYYHYDVV